MTIMINCSNCTKKLYWFNKKDYIYPAKGNQLKITSKKVICIECFEKDSCYSWHKNDVKIFTEFVVNYTSNKFDTALQKLESMEHKKNINYWYNKGLALFEKARWLSYDKFKNIPKLSVKNKERISGLLTKDKTDLFRKSAKCFEEAILLDTHYTKAWYWRGKALLELRQFEESIKCFENVLELDPDNGQKRKLGALLLMGANYLNLHNNKKATTYLSLLFKSINHDIIKVYTFEEFIEYILNPSKFQDLLENLVQAPIIAMSSGKSHP